MNIYILKYTQNERLFLPFLSEQRKTKTDAVKNPAVRREKIYSYALLRYALIKEYGISEPPLFSYGERGKPYLENHPEKYFSLSHAGGYTACVVSDEEIGLDIQDIRPLKADIRHKICTPKEYESIFDSKDFEPPYEICRLWCMKEARGKLTGMGFAEGFNKIETSELTEKGELYNTVTYDALFVSVCGFSPLPEINIVRLSEEKLFEMLNAMH